MGQVSYVIKPGDIVYSDTMWYLFVSASEQFEASRSGPAIGEVYANCRMLVVALKYYSDRSDISWSAYVIAPGAIGWLTLHESTFEKHFQVVNE